MYYNESWAAKGKTQGSPGKAWLVRSSQRAPVNIYKTETSFEMLVFAPGRIKEHFKLNLEGKELIVSYSPPEGFPRPDWVRREYSRGGFERSFVIDNTIEASAITAKYEDGVLHISLPIVKDAVERKTDISIQ